MKRLMALFIGLIIANAGGIGYNAYNLVKLDLEVWQKAITVLVLLIGATAIYFCLIALRGVIRQERTKHNG